MTASPKKQKKNLPPSPSKFSYPIFLDLKGKRCVVVGGGKVAERKCLSLIRAGAEITVISPALTRRLEDYRERGLISHLRRGYRSNDIRRAFLIIAATDSEETNRKAARDGMSAHKLVNVVDSPPLCNFIVPSVVKRGLLTIAISTGGASPAMAKAIRKDIENRYGPEFSRYLSRMKKMRSTVLREIPDKKERARFLKELAEQIFSR